MSIERLLQMMKLGDFVNQEYFVAQALFLSGGVLLFVLSLVLCTLAFRAARAARQASEEAGISLQTAQNLATEVRHLTAQVEKTASGARQPLEKAATGIAAASIPAPGLSTPKDTEPAAEKPDSKNLDAEQKNASSAPDKQTPIVTSLEDVVGQKENRNKQAASPDASSASAQDDKTLAFVDSEQDVAEETPAKLAFTGKGVPHSDFHETAQQALTEENVNGEAESLSPLGKLLRRRKF